MSAEYDASDQLLTMVFNQPIATALLDGGGVIEITDSADHTSDNDPGVGDPTISGSTLTVPCRDTGDPLDPGAGTATTHGTIDVTTAGGLHWTDPQTFPVTIVP